MLGGIDLRSIAVAVRRVFSPSWGASLIGFIAAGASAVQRTMQDKERDFVSVLDYGAVGNSSGIGLGTDDYAAINAAVAAAAGKTLYFPYTGNGYRVGSNLTIAANVGVVMDNSVQLYPDAGKTITFSGLIGQSLNIVVNERHEHAANGSTLNQFGTVHQITGGSGNQTISRVALYAAAQSGGGGSNDFEAANFVAQQNAADTNTSGMCLQLNFNNNKADDALSPAAAVSHYGMSIVSGGSKKVGPGAIVISNSLPGTNDWQRGIQIAIGCIASGGYAFDYAGPLAGQGDFKVNDLGRVMAGTATVGLGTGTNYQLSIDGNATAGVIASTTTVGAACYTGWNRATAGDNTFNVFLTEGGAGTSRGSITYNRGGGVVAYNTTSDGEQKNKLGAAPVDISRQLILTSPIAHYTWKEDPKGKPHIGPIAQELYASGFKGAVHVGGMVDVMEPVYEDVFEDAMQPVFEDVYGDLVENVFEDQFDEAGARVGAKLVGTKVVGQGVVGRRQIGEQPIKKLVGKRQVGEQKVGERYDPWGVDKTAFVFHLVVLAQHHDAEIEALKAKNSALMDLLVGKGVITKEEAGALA